MDRVRSLFVHLAQEELPNGYTWQQEPQNGLPARGQFNFSGENCPGLGFGGRIGTVENRSKDMVEVSEAPCDGSGVIAVAIWPHSTLEVDRKPKSSWRGIRLAG